MAPEGKPDAAACGKKRKRYLPHNKPVKKGSYPLQPGVQGLNNGTGEKSDPHEIDDGHAQAGDKANDDNKGDNNNLNTKTTDELPAVKQCCKTKVPTSDLSDKVEEKSIDKLIEAELTELRDKNKRRFVKLDSGCNGVVFVQMRKKNGDLGPKDIVHQIVTSAASTRKHMSRFILRILPIEVTCYASKEEISKAIKPLVEQHFPVETQNPHKFAVLYEARANTGIDRMEIINAVAKSVPGPHKVDLNNPDKTIVVEIAKTVCSIGVAEKYKEFSKYNLRQLTSRKA
ncbi:THUMP domain [Sesbania bispinosa]|nr:THUMP domain [Sesbania bispinosa]